MGQIQSMTEQGGEPRGATRTGQPGYIGCLKKTRSLTRERLGRAAGVRFQRRT